MATYNQISYGSKGDDVKELQTLLKNNGYNLDVDGSFGPKTQAAVKAYQKANGLDVDGVVGTNTWGALTKASSSANTSSSAASTPKFEYADYVESDAVTNAKNTLNQHLAQKPGEYQSAWQNQLNDAINKIMNREKFSYDLNGDALYQQYKDMYTTQGKMAMMDTMGQAAAATGGYGNSYAQTVGQQTYQGYLQQLNDKVPELYSLAYDRYNQEGQDLLNQYSLLSTEDEKAYGRHRDTVSDWLTERGYLTDSYNNERTYDRNIYDSDRSFNYGTFSDDWTRNYQIERDKIEDEQWQKSFDEGVRQFNANLALSKKKLEPDPGDGPTKNLTTTNPNGNIDYYNPDVKEDLSGDIPKFTGASYAQAISFVKKYGGDANYIIPSKEFRLSNGNVGLPDGGSYKFKSYGEYLDFMTDYLIS